LTHISTQPEDFDDKHVRRLTLVDAANRHQSVLLSAANKYALAIESSPPFLDGVEAEELGMEFKSGSTKRQGRILHRHSGKITELFPCGADEIGACLKVLFSPWALSLIFLLDSTKFKPETIEEKMKRKR
jgi:hypothetical protein